MQGGGQRIEHPSWWSTASLVAFRRNGSMAPSAVRMARWDKAKPGQLLFVPCQTGDYFSVSPGHETAWKRYFKWALQDCLRGKFKLLNWVRRSQPRKTWGKNVAQKRGSICKGLEEKECTITCPWDRERVMSGAPEHNDVETNGRAAPLRAGRPRGLCLGALLFHWEV